ncbi:MAG TPA: SpoIIE family protein phosphatase [Bryobacteraceae bacterium]|jgi:serine phosphatase RsbU (regulator of sigma subunit)/pSer/pThr/pTyr-binding forkhead associated (FHA) protein|nr:SpoIIE family protein phosphatase [Bryobacteraceae bacterium]
MTEPTRLEFNDAQGRRVVRIEKEVFSIGRRSGNDLQLTGPEISRDHAQIFQRDGKRVLRDLESRYGSFVNGERVTERVLANLDRVHFGGNSPEMLYIEQGTGSVERVADLAVGDLRQVSSLLEGLRAMGSSRVLDDILALVLDSAIDVSGAERGFIMLATAEGQNIQRKLEFKLGRGRGRQLLAGTVFQTSNRIPEQVFLTGRPQIVTDMLEGDWAGAHGATIAMGIRHVLCVPLRLVHFAETHDAVPNEEGRIGVLYLDSRDKGSLSSPVTRTALETLANEAAVAIENTRLYREALDKARIEQELNIAGDMQQALLPPRQRRGAGFEAVGAMFPCRAIGGDFFDYLELADGRIGFVLCDVSGKGPSAALMTAMIQGIFRALAEDAHSPALTMTLVNRVLARRAIASRYATGFYGVLAPNGRFVSSNAGHNPPIVMRRDGAVHRLEKGGTPLGLFAKSAFEEEELTLTPGDTLLLFSDGLSEAENSNLEEFGEDRLIETIAAERHREPEALLDFLVGKARNFAGSQPQSDDITALVIRCAAV